MESVGLEKVGANAIELSRINDYATQNNLFLWHISVGRQPIKQQFQRIETGINNTLVLRNVQRQHEGNYTCIVRNSLGSDQIVYQLYVHVPPGPPELHVSATSATTVTLEWAVERKYTHTHNHISCAFFRT